MTRLEAERRRRGWSQTVLAARAERLALSDISRFERRYATPYPAQASRLARVLNVAPSDLMTEVAAPSSSSAADGVGRRG